MEFSKRISTNRGEVTLFFESRSPFSNFNPSPFVVGDTLYQSNEQFYQALKAERFNDEPAKRAILAAKTPYKQKQLGHLVKNFDEKVWDSMCYGIMKDGCYLKFSQNRGHREALFKTKGSILAESSPFDAKWGIGLSIVDPRVVDAAHWPGKNLLGKALTEVRDELMAEQEDEMREATELKAYYYTKYHRVMQHSSLGDEDEARIMAFVDATEAEMISSGVFPGPYARVTLNAHALADRRTHYYGVFHRIVENVCKGDMFEGNIKSFLDSMEKEMIDRGVISKPAAPECVEDAMVQVTNILRSGGMESLKLKMLHELFYPREMYKEPIKHERISGTFLGGPRWRASLDPFEVIKRFLLENGCEVKFVGESPDRDHADATAMILFMNAFKPAVEKMCYSSFM